MLANCRWDLMPCELVPIGADLFEVESSCSLPQDFTNARATSAILPAIGVT